MWSSSCNIPGAENMGHEISQFDIPDRQLLAAKTQQRERVWNDIGEAKITRTIFGGARIRVVRERDKKLRAWLVAALVVTALAVAAWQGWIALQQSGLLATPRPLSERIKVSAPVFEPKDISPIAPSSTSRRQERTPTQIVIDSMTTRRPPPPPQQSGLNAPEPKPAKQVKAQPLTASKPQTAAPATQPEVNRPAAVAPLAEPLIKEDTSTPSPAGDQQPSAPANAQP
jgi:hypothetical protein